MNFHKKLYRSRHERMIGGLAGGIGEYFGVDPVVVRVALLLLAVFTAFVPMMIGYVLMLMIVPQEPEMKTEEKKD
jgi:phage shock protein C